MSIFGRFITKQPIETSAAAGISAAAPAAASAPLVRQAAASTVFVELGEAAQKAQIARDGVGVPQVQIDPTTLQGILAGRPQLVTKVVSQSVPPGTPVPKGTAIDVVLAQPGLIPIDVIPDPHVSLKGRTLGNVFDTFIKDSPDVRNVLARNDSAATLSTADQGVIQNAFQAQDIPIGTQPGQTIDQAFKSLQAAFAFGA